MTTKTGQTGFSLCLLWDERAFVARYWNGVADDGSLTVDGTGHWLVGYFPTDSPSSALIYYSGHIVIRVSPEGHLTLVSYIGAPPQDVCAMIE